MPKEKEPELKEEVKQIPKEEIEKTEKQMLIETLMNINERLTKLEKSLSVQIPQNLPQNQSKVNQLMNNPMAMQMLLSMFKEPERSPIDKFFRDLGERTFFQVMNRWLPSKKELRGSEK